MISSRRPQNSDTGHSKHSTRWGTV